MILSVLSSLALVSGLMVARAKNPVHSVLFPIPVFRDTSGLLLLLGLDFSAMIFPVVHIGAIAVSFLFVVMMFHIQIAEIHEEVLRYLPVSGIIGLIFWWEMFFILDNETIPLLPTQRNTTSLRYTVYAGKTNTLETTGPYGATPLRSEAIPARANWVFALTQKDNISQGILRRAITIPNSLFGGVGLSRLGRAPKVVAPSHLSSTLSRLTNYASKQRFNATPLLRKFLPIVATTLSPGTSTANASIHLVPFYTPPSPSYLLIAIHFFLNRPEFAAKPVARQKPLAKARLNIERSPSG
ncbi:hypothetical protein QYF36_014801 [Acer negundo]|nr:hypothetical protein QYF36_014801 [Acer negundo]